MTFENVVPWLAAALILARWGAETVLALLNRRSVLAHADQVPESYRELLDEATYARSVRYSLARIRFGLFEEAWSTGILLAVLFSGLLPWGHQAFASRLGPSAWSMAAFLFATGLALSLPGLPLEWHEQFRLEDRFGFNTTSRRLWWMDRLKGLLLAAVLGYPLLVLILKLVQWTGGRWWLWAWGSLMGFQLLMVVLAPFVILPLFNTFTPLPEGSLRERLLELARRTGFTAHHIQVMDGSKRSMHSNAFFTGFGRFRKIVLFDTLVQQLTEEELEAVLAHEIGHFRRRHILKRLGLSAFTTLAGSWLLSLLAAQPWFAGAFGFEPGNLVAALLLFALLAGTATFWLSPLTNGWSRKHEYEADAFAALAMGGPLPLVSALRKLNEKNLSNLTPHPLFSRFHHSHPTLPERERALLGRG